MRIKIKQNLIGIIISISIVIFFGFCKYSLQIYYNSIKGGNNCYTNEISKIKRKDKDNDIVSCGIYKEYYEYITKTGHNVNIIIEIYDSNLIANEVFNNEVIDSEKIIEKHYIMDSNGAMIPLNAIVTYKGFNNHSFYTIIKLNNNSITIFNCYNFDELKEFDKMIVNTGFNFNN